MVGGAYGPVALAASGGSGGGYTWSATGLPPGMGIDPTTGGLTGTPTSAGIFDPVFTVTDSASATFSTNISLIINSISALRFTGPITLSEGTGGGPDGPVTFQATGGTGYVWSATGLPTNMSIDPSTGVLSGIPVAAGTFNPQFVL